MADVARSELWDEDGRRVWTGPCGGHVEALSSATDRAAHSTLRMLGGQNGSEKSCTSGDVVRLAEELEFISREGCPPGFFNVLPAGTFLDLCVECFNRDHLEALGANRIDFPLVYDAGPADIRALTRSYEAQGRVFKLEAHERELRLAYAADPGLFSWLRNKSLKPSLLPYAVYSPVSAFRRWQSGEVGGFAKMRQYTVPDLHILSGERDAWAVYQSAIKQGAAGARFWFGEEWAQYVDVDENFLENHSDVGAAFATAAQKLTLVNVLRRRPRYYAIKNGIMVGAGFTAMMLYNLQWDDTNAARFNISIDDSQELVIIHATVAGGWPKLLPMFLGRGLTGTGPKIIPVECAARQILILPIDQSHLRAAELFSERLQSAGLRTAVDTSLRPLAQRLRQLRQKWQPFYCVIGDRESNGAEPLIQTYVGGAGQSAAEFLTTRGERIRRCSPPAARAPKPLPLA